MSVSSPKLIRERTNKFCKTIKNWNLDADLFEKINDVLTKEYDMIPEKERIGKGIKFISNHVAKSFFQYLSENNKINKNFIFTLVETSFDHGVIIESQILQLYSLHIIAEFVSAFPGEFEELIPLIEKYACDKNWIVRETIADAILSGLKKIPETTLKLMIKWAKSNNENLRRLVSESLRPHSSVKWLRDPTKNDKIIEILTILRQDPSIYVRKSVGNNLKDLTKYMPTKILFLVETWINEAGIEVHDALASEINLNKEQKNLIWTIKQAMRWLKNKNPEYHPHLEKILGKNYIHYFDEKRNRFARATSKR